MAADKNVEIVFRATSAQAAKQIKSLRGDLKGMATSAETAGRKSERGFGRAGKGLVSLAGKFALGAGAATTFYRGVSRTIDRGSQFQTSLAQLEAITGITGDRLDRLGERSLELSIKYGESADAIIEANKLVASQLAQKIDFNTEEGFQQLQEISEQAVILQKAAGIDLASAVETTTSVINQFNLEASESERVINTLAAGSKYGAAEVPAIGRALVNAGAAAAGAGQSIEATNAAIQVLAANGQVGERAGTALRAVFTRLQTSAGDLAKLGIENVDVASNGLVATLRQLEPLLEDTAATKKIFGEEALNQIQILIRNADAVEDLTEKVTGTTVAHEQSEVQLNTFKTAQARLANAIDAQLIPAFQKTEGLGVRLMDTLANLVVSTGRATKAFGEFLDSRERIMTIEETLHADATFGWEYWNASMRARDILQSLISETQSYKTEVDIAAGYVRDFTEQLQDLDEGSQLYNNLSEAVTDNRLSLALAEMAARRQVETTKEQIRQAEASGAATGLLEEQLREYGARLSHVQEALQLVNKITREQKAEQDDAANATETASELLQALSEEYAENEERIKELVRQTGELTDADREEIKARLKKNEELKKEIELWDQLLRKYGEVPPAPDRPSAPIQTPDDSPIAPEALDLESPDLLPDFVRESIDQLMQMRREAEEAFTAASSEGARERHQQTIDWLNREIQAKEEGITYQDVLQQEQQAKERARHEERIQQAAQYVQAISGAVSNIAGIFSAQHDRRIQELQREQEQRLENVNADLQNTRLSERRRQQLLKERQQIEEEYQKKINAQKRKQFSLDKKANIAQAVMQTSIAVVQALPNLILAGIAAAAGAAQIASIAAKPNPYEKGGWIGGRRHKEGGTIIEAEKDEYVTNRRSSMSAPRTLEYINSGPAAARKVESLFDQYVGDSPAKAETGGWVQPTRTDRPARAPQIDTDAIRRAMMEGMQGVIIRPQISVSEIMQSEDFWRENQKAVGNQS